MKQRNVGPPFRDLRGVGAGWPFGGAMRGKRVAVCSLVPAGRAGLWERAVVLLTATLNEGV